MVNSKLIWDHLNYITINNYPTHIFPRRDDYGLWPIPDAVYTINFGYHLRDRNLTTADFATGTVTMINDDKTVTHSATGFTALMVGRWLQVTQDGHWYRIASFTNTSNVELSSAFQGTAGAGLSFKIGESPELPEDLHIALSHGTTEDYFRGPRKDTTTADSWEKKYDIVVNRAIKKYASRSDKRLIKRNMARKGNENVSFLWSKTIT